jgi:hypothetical protein
MSHDRFESWQLDLQELLGLAVPPVAIAFMGHVPADIERIQRTMPPATADGRTGAVAASCVFWIEGAQGVFATEAQDHGMARRHSSKHGGAIRCSPSPPEPHSHEWPRPNRRFK